jgi:putative membrane protein
MMHNSFLPYFSSFGIWPGIIGMALNIALIIGVVMLVVWMVKQVGQSHSSQDATGAPLSAREILDLRYVRGELSREEYQAMRHDILEASS